MKSIVTLSALAFVLTSAAQEVPDTVSYTRALEEVSVTATPVIRKTDRDVYTISDETAKRSSTPLNLLTNIGIPSLSVNDIMRKITVAGDEVEVRINGRKASVDQLAATPLENIRRVEFIDNPGLKYDGAAAVLNIVVINPEQGGSLSLTEMQALSYGWNNTNGALTLELGKHQFKITTFSNLRHNLPIFRDYEDRYVMPDGTVIQRTETPDAGHFKNLGIYPGFDYNYLIPDKTNIYISTWFPMNFGQELLYAGDITTYGEQGSTRLTDKQINPNKNQALSAYIEQHLPHDQIFMANIGWGGRTDKSRRIYTETPDNPARMDEITIDNNIRNRSSSWSAETDYTKKFGKSNLIAGLRYSGSSNKATYLYDNAPDLLVRQTSDRLYFFGEYSTMIGKWNISAGAAGTWQNNSTDGTHVSNLHFTPRFSAAWRFNDISRWALVFTTKTYSPTLSQTSGVMQQIDGFQLQQGNPGLKAYPIYRTTLKYSIAAGSNFSGNISTTIAIADSPIQEYYTTHDDKILKSWSNDGNSYAWDIIMSPRWEYMPGWATLSGSLSFRRFWANGNGFSHTLSNWYGETEASFYHWGFNVNLSYQRAGAVLFGQTIERGESYSELMVGYKWKDWHFSFGLFNPFGRYSQETRVISDLVSQKTVMRTTACNCMPFIHVTYNINWGRKTRYASKKLESELSGGGASAAGR